MDITPEEEEHRLLEMREYLDVTAKIDDKDFEREVVVASSSKLNTLLSSPKHNSGEDFILDIASKLKIHFEEVHTPEDVDRLKDEYLKKEKEIGFGQLELELNNPDVDALLFKRQKKPDHYVAVLNLQNTGSRAYWNRSHETSHRLIEPPQKELFHRHRANTKNRVEHIVDLVAAEIAFFGPIFKPIVEQYSNTYLTWEIVEDIRSSFAPTSSLLSITKAIIKHWPVPVFLFTAQYQGRKNNPLQDQALRITLNDRNSLAGNAGIYFYKNMRVPLSSPAYHSFLSTDNSCGEENLSTWTTSRGDSLPSRNAFTSAKPYGKNTIILISIND